MCFRFNQKEKLNILKELVENYNEKIRKEIIEKVKELLDNNGCVYSKLLGRMGKVIGIDEKGRIKIIFKKCEGRKTLNSQCYGITSIATGDPVYIKKEENCWFLTNFNEKE